MTLEVAKLNPSFPEQEKSSGYLIQFDGIRALAIAAVLADHLSNGVVSRALPLGLMGVRLFFVLSGFLITRILLNARDHAEAGIHSRKIELGHFYCRRFLRIFPIYYLTVGATCALAWPMIGNNVLWHITYTSNIYVTIVGGWPPLVSHFWSLAVEEQFYLVWPWVILFCPRRAILPLIAAVACIGPLYRLLAVLMGANSFSVFVATPSALDSLGMGALLVLLNKEPALRRVKAQIMPVALWSALAGLVILMVLQKAGQADLLRKVLWYALVSVVCGWAVDRACAGFGQPAKWLLENPIAVWIGKVSYGVYLYHPLVIYELDKFTDAGHHSSIWFKFSLIVLKLAAIFCVSAISWVVIEKPLNALKRYFAY